MSSQEFQAFLREYQRLLERLAGPGAVDEAKRLAKDKNQIARMLPFIEAVTELVNSQALIPATSIAAARNIAFGKLCGHARGLVEDAARLFLVGRFATAQFLGIVAIEEIGKIAVARFQVVAGIPSSASDSPNQRTKKSLRSHHHKHYLAACAGAVINSRLDRILGSDRVINFLELAESGELEAMRQASVYYELRGTEQYLPHNAVSEVDARELIAIAAELLAEVGSVEPVEFEAMIKWAESIERRIGFDSQDSTARAT